MHNPSVIIFVKQDYLQEVFTNHTCKDFGIFHIYGGSARTPDGIHPVILTDMVDTGHVLKINVSYGLTGRFTVENVSDPASTAIFSFKHSGQSKKKFRPGEIISPPESYQLIWDSFAPDGRPVQVTLTLIPLSARLGLQVYYTLQYK